jgi:tetratricopeptide (TPR) repeat protein
MSEQPTVSAEELEQLGDEALSAEQLERALQHYGEARRLLCEALDLVLGEDADFEVISMITDDLSRVGEKAHDVWSRLQPPPKSHEEQAAELRAMVDVSMESGDLAHASHMSFRLGETLEDLGDLENAESAYRQAVVLAREVDASDPELMLAAFASLIHFLSPSEESVALAEEMAANLIDRKEMYHPMRAAEAAYHCAIAELEFAEVNPHRVDHAMDAIARPTIKMLDDICFHERSQALQRLAAEVLRGVGRDVEADQWQADAEPAAHSFAA